MVQNTTNSSPASPVLAKSADSAVQSSNKAPASKPEVVLPPPTRLSQKLIPVFGTKENLAYFASCVRFLIALPLCLMISVIFHDDKIGGFACLAAFMVLLADTKSTLVRRILSSLLVLLVVIASVAVGYLCQYISYGKWVVVVICSFGASLLPFTEFFWWAVSKYFLIFLLVSLFDFVPDLAALEGYGIGFVIALGVIIADSIMWRLNQLGVRPIDQLKQVLQGVHNSWSFAVISALILFLSLWTGYLAELRQLAWVGISVIYLLGTKISVGLKRSYQRVVGTALGYAAVVAIFSTPVSYHLYVRGPLIVLFGTPIPYFIVKDYLMANVCITGYILLDLEWLLKAYGGDGNLLGWRLFDTCWGAVWAVIGFILMAIISHYRNKRAKG